MADVNEFHKFSPNSLSFALKIMFLDLFENWQVGLCIMTHI